MKLALLGTDQTTEKIKQYFTEQGINVRTFDSTVTIKRIHKSGLMENEEIPNRSRMADMFKIVYALNPKDHILKNVEENPEVYSKFNQSMIDALSEEIEVYEEFDVVVDARNVLEFPRSMGASSAQALNEERMKKKELIYYGVNGIDLFLSKYESQLANLNIVVVGDGDVALSGVLKLTQAKKLTVVTNSTTPFNQINSVTMNEKYQSWLEKMESDYEYKKNIHFAEMNKWKELEDYEKAKISPPKEPALSYEIKSGLIPVSLDMLQDNKNVFLTVERPSFRGGDHLETIACDFIIVATGHQLDLSWYKGLSLSADNTMSVIQKEPGIYFVNTGTNIDEVIATIENDLLKFFSKN